MYRIRYILFSLFIRLEQQNAVPMGQFFDAVSKCKSLVQLAVIAPTYSDPFDLKAKFFSAEILNLVDSCRLVALHIVLSVPETHCSTAIKIVVETITPKRPSFCIELLSRPVSEAESSLPFVHSNALVRFDSDVFALPYGDDSI